MVSCKSSMGRSSKSLKLLFEVGFGDIWTVLGEDDKSKLARCSRAGVLGLLTEGLKGGAVSLARAPFKYFCKHCLLPTPADNELVQHGDDDDDDNEEQRFVEVMLVDLRAVHAPLADCCQRVRARRAAVAV